MRRFLLAAAVLLTVAVSTSSAGYLIIRVLLEGSGGATASMPPVGAAPPGGSAIGGRGAGGPGSLGGGGGGPPGTSAGGFGSGGGPPGTSAGGGGAPPRGMQPPGGMTPGGAPGAAHSGPTDPTRSIVVVIPFTKKPVKKHFYPKIAGHPMTNPDWDLVLTTPFGNPHGSTNLFTDGSTIEWYMNVTQSPALDKTRSTQVTDKYTAWQKTKGIQPLYELTAEALEHGMVTEAVKYADELLALTKTAKTPPSDEVKNFAQVYAAVWPKVTSPATKPSDGQRWRDVLDSANARVTTQGHYSLVYWDASNEEVGRKFRLLDENFRAFYLWHALQGVALPVPEKPLVAVLPPSVGEVFRLWRGLDGMPIEADACYSQEHDILVLSPERVDDAGQTFLRQNQQVIYKDGLSRAKLLQGDGPKIDGHNNKEHVARMMTLALVEKHAEMESEYAQVSREGCRQLMHASGALPQHVVLPRWLSNGAANFFTRPKGPVYSKRKTTELPTEPLPGSVAATPPQKYTMTIALSTGYGGPNYVMQKYFRDMQASKELHADPGVLLKNVVTDAYFHALAKDGEDVDPLPKELVAVPIPRGGAGAPPPGGGVGSFPGGVSGPPPGMVMGPPGTSAGGGTPPRGGSGGGPPPGMMMAGGGGGSAMMAAGGHVLEDLLALKRKKVERLSNKAQATSWALYYFLAKNHKDGLKRFLDELARLPRDLPIDDQTTLNAFARAFNLTTAATRENGKKSLGEFGAEWMKFMLELTPVGIDINLVDPPAGPGMMPPPAFPGGGGGTG